MERNHATFYNKQSIQQDYSKQIRRKHRPSAARAFEREMKENGLSWAQVEHLARNRDGWRSLVLALCATGHEED